MAEVSPNLILYPLFAMFALAAIVLLRMRSMRFAAVRTKSVDLDYYRTFHGGVEPEELRAISRNFSNLFEAPMLFYVVAILIYVTDQVGYTFVVLAWVYVVLRYAHTWVHITSNRVEVRFGLYIASNAVLLAMWSIQFFLLLRA